MSFPKYPKYRDSGVEWLGEVPEGWRVTRADAVLRYVREPAQVSSFRGLAVFHYSIPAIQETGDGAYEEGEAIESDKIALSGDELLVSKLNPRKGVVLVSQPHDVPLVCSTEFVPMRAVGCDLRFAYWIYASEPIRARISSLVHSVTRSHQRASPGDIVRQWLPMPPHPEQRAIASFLDRETAKIDALVTEQQRLIELLKEKRQAIISHAVTKGLDPHAPMKSTGIEWIGDMPAHWQIGRLGHYATIENGTTPSRVRADYWANGEVPWLSSGEVNQPRIVAANEFITELALEECSLRLLPRGTVVVGMIGQGRTRGLSAILEIEACINQNLAAIIPGSSLRSYYLHHLFQASYNYLREWGRGGNQAALNCEILAATRLPLPPLAEQAAICQLLSRQAGLFDALIAESERAIALLKERRTALISAAVTGRIDVRDLARTAA